MKKITRNLIIIISVLILTCGFVQDSVEIKDTKDFYTTKNIKHVFELGVYSIKIKGNKIHFNPVHGEIRSPLEYNNLYTEFNFNNIYQLKDSLNNIYYFRFGWVSFNENETIFSNLQWINNNKPADFDNFKNLKFTVVNIDYIQFGNSSVCTLGDSQTWYSNAQSLRKFINNSNKDLIFIGTNTDIFGYGHEGEGGDNTNKLLERINNIPKADYYTLLIGTNDWKNDMNVAYSNILKITDYLTFNNTNSKIIYLTPIPTTNKERDLFNIKLSEKLLVKFMDSEQITILDLGKKMRENKDWASDYLSNDGLHQNIDGVKFMADLIGEKIKTLTLNN